MSEDNSVIDPGARRIVNQNNGVSNILDMDASEDQIIDTLDRCATILKGHCGPQSGYAMVLEDMSAGMDFKPSLFTRDGIRILSAVEFMSPMERYIKDMLTYIGGRVDNSAKDGTTTSMLFSSLFLKNLITKRKEIQKLNLSFFQMKNLVDQLFAVILTQLRDKYVFSIPKLAGVESDAAVTEEEAMRLAGKVAFIQALSSSGGNMDLALAMKEIFEKSPRVAWEFIESKTSRRETGKSFQVEVDEYDSRIRCVATSNNNFNTMLGTEYTEENVRVIVVPGALDDGAVITDEVSELLKLISSDEPVVLISTFLSARLLTEIVQLNTNRAKDITVWQYSPEHQLAGQAYPWELMTLAAIACIEPPLYESNGRLGLENTFIAKKVTWHDTYMDFFGVLEMADNSCLHPFFGHPEKATTFYTEVVEQITKILDEYREGHRPDGKMFGFFQEVLNKLACVHRPMLRLGGPVHEQYANKEIIQDVQGAIMSSLTNGFLINGSFGLYAVSSAAVINTNDKKELDFIALVRESISASLVEVLDTIFTLPGKHSDDILTTDAIQLMHQGNFYQNVLAEDPHPFSFAGYLELIPELGEQLDADQAALMGKIYPVAQPLVITKELLKRTQELLMKFINTNKIVIIGGVVVDKQE